MKILHVTHYVEPGRGYTENCLPPAQLRLGHDVRMITSNRYHPHPDYKETMNWSESDRVVEPGPRVEDGVDVLRLEAAWEWPEHWWIWMKGLAQAIRAYDPDVMHVHTTVHQPSTIQTLLINRKLKYPCVVDTHNVYFNIVPISAFQRVYYLLFKHLVRHLVTPGMDRVLPIMEEARQLAHKEFGIPPDFTTIFALGADAHKFQRRPEERARVREKLGIPHDAIVLVNGGKVTIEKDNHVLLEAIGQLKDRLEDLYLIMIGNAPADYGAQLTAIMDKHLLHDRVKWLDLLPHDQLPAYYTAGDIGVWPGDASITFVECMACQIPLIVPHADYTDYAMTNNNGLRFKRGDVNQLADAIHRLATDHPLRQQMGRNALQLVHRELSWDALARRSIDIYQRAIDRASFEGL